MKVNCPLSYDENGNLEVLVSTGFGAGWSTWNAWGINLAVDKRIIDFFKANLNPYDHLNQTVTDSKLNEFIHSIGYTGNFYFGGFYDCRIRKVSPGTMFKIREYDGAERIEVFDDSDWFTVKKQGEQ